MVWVNATIFLTCGSRFTAYGGAWVATREFLGPLQFVDKNALEYASFELFSHASFALKTRDDSFWVNHMSGYEHNLRRSFREEAIIERMNEFARGAVRENCFAARPNATRPLLRARETLAVVPFYGGKPGTNTGSAHSLVDRSLKLRMLHAVICSAARYARTVLVGVCEDRDLRDVAQLVDKMDTFFTIVRPARAVTHLLDCAAVPGYLPFRLLSRVQRAARPPTDDEDDMLRDLRATSFSYVIYTEADQTLHFESDAALLSTFAVLHDVSRSYVAPQRYEKSWGSPPGRVDRKFFKKAMNKCHESPRHPIHSTTTGLVYLPEEDDRR